MRSMRRGILTIVSVLVVGLAGCKPNGGAGAGPCGPVEHPQLQSGGHLLGDREPPVPYSSTPPTSGWHASGKPLFGSATTAQPLSEPGQVSVLEAGGVVISYRDLAPAELATLESVERDFPDQVALTPYAKLAPHELALTAWGTLQRCDGVDAGIVRGFIEAHAGDTSHAH